jgi:RNA polymerase sigma-70 factor (ECF subfamily)
VSPRRRAAGAGSAATVVDVEVVDEVDVLVLVVLLLLVVVDEDGVLVVGATTSTTVGCGLSWSERLNAAVAATRAPTTMQRLRRTDVCFILRLTLQRPGKLPPARCSSVTAWEGFRTLLRPTSGVGEIDELVVARARRGDHDAFAGVVGHYDHRLRALAFRLLGDRDRMDDVLQEVYVKAFHSLPRFRGDAALGTWLYRITYNACLDDLRRRPPAPAAAEYDDDLADPTAGPAELAVQRQDLAAALDGLPADQRTAVLLVDAYGLDYAGAAAVLGVRAGTIGSRLSRARSVLRAALDEGGAR